MPAKSLRTRDPLGPAGCLDLCLDPKDHAALLALNAQSNPAAGWRELEGIANEVTKHLRQAERISANHRSIVRPLDAKLDLLSIGEGPKRVFTLLNDVGNRDILHVE